MKEFRDYTTEFELRARPTGGVIVEGHAAVFNSVSRNLGGFVEVVAPGAFRDTIRAADVRALFNHDSNLILGRTTAGTLRLSEDREGLAYEIDVPDTTAGRDLQVSMERRDITQSSFGFNIPAGGDSWSQTNDGYPLRTLNRASLDDGDISPVTYPAYTTTDSGLARALRSLADDDHTIDALVEAAKANTLARALTEEPADDDERRSTVPVAVAQARLAHLARPSHWTQLTNG